MTEALRIVGDHAIRSYADLVDAFRARKAAVGLSNAFVEDALQMCESACDKYLGPSQVKRMSLILAMNMVELMGCELVLRPAPDIEAKMRPVWEKRQAVKVHPPERPLSPRVFEKALPKVVRQMGRNGGLKRAACLPPSRRIEIACSGGKAKARVRREMIKAALAEQDRLPIKRGPK